MANNFATICNKLIQEFCKYWGISLRQHFEVDIDAY